jgi:hypothetical protein
MLQDLFLVGKTIAINVAVVVGVSHTYFLAKTT